MEAEHRPESLTAEEREVVDQFRQLFLRHHQTAFFCNTWLGVPTLQHPFDVWVTQEIIAEIAPEVIVEAGGYQGGSALLWAMILDQVEPEGRVVTIDVGRHTALAEEHALFRRKVDWIEGSSTDPAVVAEVARRCEGRRTLVILDSSHKADHVRAELDAYAGLVSAGSYLIVQDGHAARDVPGHGPGPLEALEGFLTGDDRFEVDGWRERMLFTANPSGFLRRVG